MQDTQVKSFPPKPQRPLWTANLLPSQVSLSTRRSPPRRVGRDLHLRMKRTAHQVARMSLPDSMQFVITREGYTAGL